MNPRLIVRLLALFAAAFLAGCTNFPANTPTAGPQKGASEAAP